jgi:hypothetical protein
MNENARTAAQGRPGMPPGFPPEGQEKILIPTQAVADALTGDKFHPCVFSTLRNAMMHSRSGAYRMAAKPYKRYMCVGPDDSGGHASGKVFKSEVRLDVEIVGERLQGCSVDGFLERSESVLKVSSGG